MSQLEFCLVTPSYKPDFARCRLLLESIERFFILPVHHYIVVDRQDYSLFQQLATNHRTIITVESILPWWIQKIPLIKNGWFSFKTLPIRNWLIQQIVKLEMANHLDEDIFVFVDSDVSFVRSFDYQQFVREGKVRLYKEIRPLSLWKSETPDKWFKTANSLLDLPPFTQFSDDNPIINYVGNVITWRRDCVLQLQRHLEEVNQKPWIEAIANSWNFSEYVLYGIFVDRILAKNSGHYGDSHNISHDYWGTKPLNNRQLQQFFQDIPAECCAVMISAKSQMSVATYEHFMGLHQV